MNKYILTFLSFLCIQLTYSQESPFYKDYNWEAAPDYSSAVAGSDEGIISVKNDIVTEFYFEKDDLVEYHLEHEIIWLNSDDAIEENNKIYLPYSQTSEMMVNKARVISKSGTIIELDESKIQIAEDEETGRKYKYFAFEGVEKESFIEYFYVVKKYPVYQGKRLTLQASHPKKNVSFDFFAPDNLFFKFKSYNGIPEVELDTTSTEKFHWKFKLAEMDALEEEAVSAYEASKGYIIYKLHKNLVNNKSDFASYATISQNLYSYYYPTHPKKTNNALKKFIAEAVEDKNSSEENKIRSIERFIKTNFYLADGSSPELQDIEQVLKDKVANERGIMKLYTAILSYMKIKHEIVITSDRQYMKFDNTFEARNFLNNFLLYFPKHKTYMSPTEVDSRYGYPPAYYSDNYGLFIKEVALGDFKSGVGKVKYIKAVDAENSVDKMILNVAFDADDFTKNLIKIERSMSGYYAMYIQPYTDLFKEETKTEFLESIAKNLDDNVVITQKELSNDSPSLFGIKPLKVNVEFESEAFVENAGNKYLFNVGELIGTQMQMYQEKKRVLPVESEFNRSYYRTITVNIPEGYHFVNLDDINIKNAYSADGNEILSFHSFYELKDNVLTITANELYNQNIIDTSKYEEYRTVINSAADFNKISLILEPK